VVSHPPRKTRFRLLVQLYRTGLVTRRAPSERFQAYDYPPFPSFLAQAQVKNVVILDGANDFLLPLKAVEAGTLEPAAYAAALPGITAQAGANLTTAVTTLLASSPPRRGMATIRDKMGH
jgi:hypothetical protein